MRIRTTTRRVLRRLLREERGQSAIEFALVLPLLITFIFLITDFSRLFNAYNDLNQMAADGARQAAVGNFPGSTALVAASADTNATKSAQVTVTYSGGTCTVGGTVQVDAKASVGFVPWLQSAIPSLNTAIPLDGHSEMRVERCS